MIFFYCDFTAFHEVPITPHCFPSRNITKNAETHPPYMRGVIIEQPLIRNTACVKWARKCPFDAMSSPNISGLTFLLKKTLPSPTAKHVFSSHRYSV